MAAELARLHVKLAVWQHFWARIRGDPELRTRVAEEAGLWSQRALELSGLLGPVEHAAGVIRGVGSLEEALQEEHRKELKSGR